MMKGLAKFQSWWKAGRLSAGDLLISLILIMLPLSIKITNYLLGILALVWIIQQTRRKTRQSLPDLASILINIFPFLFAVATLVYCENLKLGFHAIEKYLPLLAFPVIVSSLNRGKEKEFFLTVFSYSILLMALICFGFNLYKLLFTAAAETSYVGDSFNKIASKWNVLTNTQLMNPFEINPIYMSLYVSLAFYVLLLKNISRITLRILPLVFLMFFQFLIGSRIGMLAFFSALIILILQSSNSRSRLILTGIMFISIIVSALAILTNPVLKKRFVGDLSKLMPAKEVDQWNAVNLRVAIWDCSIAAISQSPFLGYGVSSQYGARDKCYKEKYTFYGHYGTHLNSHNQYLEYFLIGGIFLLVLFMIQLGFSLYIALNRTSTLHLVFLVLFGMVCLGESLLETQKGIVFFALCNSLFIYGTKNQDV